MPRAQVAFEHLEFLTVLKADDVIRSNGLADCHRRFRRIGSVGRRSRRQHAKRAICPSYQARQLPDRNEIVPDERRNDFCREKQNRMARLGHQFAAALRSPGAPARCGPCDSRFAFNVSLKRKVSTRLCTRFGDFHQISGDLNPRVHGGQRWLHRDKSGPRECCSVGLNRRSPISRCSRSTASAQLSKTARTRRLRQSRLYGARLCERGSCFYLTA